MTKPTAPALSAIYDTIRRHPDVLAIGGGDPLEVGTTIFDFVARHLPLSPDLRVLDLGCGFGRSSAPFAEYLTQGRGQLVGVDVIASMVDFCRRAIEPTYPNARFFAVATAESYLTDQQRENPRDLPTAEEVLTRAAPFDLVLAFSVFTHLLPSEMEAYFGLFERILAVDGRLLLTFFFLD